MTPLCFREKGVNLVDEDDTRLDLFGFFEESSYSLRALSHKHLVKCGSILVDELHIGLLCYTSCYHSLPYPRLSIKQDPFWNFSSF